MKRSPLKRKTPLRTRTRLTRSAKRMKARRDATYAAKRYRCVQDVTWRQCGLCACGCERSMSEVHEEPPRSHGGDPTNPLDCIGLTNECHKARHVGTGARRLRIAYLDGTSVGRVEFRRGDARWVTLSRDTTGPVIIDGEHDRHPLTAGGVTRKQYLEERGIYAN